MKKIISTENAPKAIGPYSQAVMVKDMLYTSGQVAINPVNNELELGDVVHETKLVMSNLKAVLEAAGMDFSHVVKSSIFLKDMNDFAQVNEIYATYFKDAPPARETVQVARLPKDATVEISMIACKG